MTQEEKKNTKAAAPEAEEPAEQNAGPKAEDALTRNLNKAQDEARPEAKAEGAPDEKLEEKTEEKAGEKSAEKPRRRRRPLTLVAGGMLVVLCAAMGLRWEADQRVFERAVESATPDAAVRITVETGDSARRVMERLRKAGLQVKDFDMRLAARLVKDHKLSSIHTGTYEFKPGLTPAGILETLARGPIVDQSLRIPDGAPVWEVLAIFRNATALKQTAASMPEDELRRALGIDAGSLEGWFAPDTYHYTSGSADLAVMKQAVAKQKALLAKAWESRSEAARVKTPYEALTLASIIEKETGLATDRHLVSSVFNNRLRIGMPLQTDPTVIYGLGENFSGNITRKDLQTPTPYNTYVIPALPPTPIAAPTWASIEAAVNPADTRFLYFVSKGDGSSHFSQSLAEHNRAVRQFILNRPKTQKKAKPKEPQPTKETARSITPV